ncbi:WG repeat protein [Chitinophaga dinghuensis]|uniref:WG repeat protein n=2 Tax=Chitinophaga dinghuensis TaxID=1539050 RepID=A0A327VW24_9BACT|nr:WG repeat protein [Chitinophaga dinghuensis]
MMESCETTSSSGSQPRFLIQENNKYGYMNERGETVIAARFAAAQPFSEGLAAVREEGLYGYIDESGRPVIASKFDYALPFSEGLAFAYIGDIGQYIDRSGNTIIAGFSEGDAFLNGKAIVGSRLKRYGLIDRTGKLLVDTIYQNLILLKDGLLLKYKGEDSPWELTDSMGHPHPVMEEIVHLQPPSDGYMIAELKTPDSKHNNALLLDSSAKEIFRYNSSNLMPERLSDGKIILSHPDSIGPNSGFLFDLHNKQILLRGIGHSPTGFSSNRTFMEVNDKIVLVKGNGDTIPSSFNNYKHSGFQYGYAFVESGNKYGMIDTTGKYIIAPQYEDILEYQQTAQYFFFSQQDKSGKDKIGMADRTGKTIIPPSLDAIAGQGFVDGLLCCYKDSLLSYIDQQGKLVWQEKRPSPLAPVNVDYQLRGYCLVEEDTTGKMRFYEEATAHYPLPQPIKDRGQYAANALQIKVDAAVIPFEKDYKGFKVQIINNTDSTIQFDAQDYRLAMNMQAYVNNSWQNLEHLPNSWCGNSYWQIPLSAGKYWELACPAYEGSLKVRLRFSLRYAKGRDMQGEVFSNEFDGSINPGQLWRKGRHYATNIMDPY